MPDLERHAWRKWRPIPWWKFRPIHANNWRWHGDGKYDLEGRDAALVALRSLGVSQEAIGELHGISKRQASRRLRGQRRPPEGDGMHISVTCRSCGGPFGAARASALYCGSACRLERRKEGLRDDSHALGD